jgi:hypothetical protein
MLTSPLTTSILQREEVLEKFLSYRVDRRARMTALRYKLLCWLLRKDLDLEIMIGANCKCYHYDGYIFEVRIKEAHNDE